MADENKIVPEPQKPDKATVPEQPIMNRGDPPVPKKVALEKKLSNLFSTAQKEAERSKVTEKKEAPQAPGKKVEQEQTAAKPRRGRLPNADKASPDKAKPPLRDKMFQCKQPASKSEKVSAAPQSIQTGAVHRTQGRDP